MAKPQDKYDYTPDKTGPLSRTTPSVRTDERVQIMDDGTEMSLTERLAYAINLVPHGERSARFGRSTKQISRYLDGADVPFSVLTMITATTGVPIDWLASGRPTYGSSGHDKWRESLAEENLQALPGSPEGQFSAEPSQDVDKTRNSSFDEEKTTETAKFRLRTTNSETIARHVSIPRYDVRASAGGGSEVVAEPLAGYISLDEQFMRQRIGRRREDLVTIEATGESMAPTIRDGSILFVDISTREIEDGRVYVLSVNDRLLVKRLNLRTNGLVVIHSDNPSFPDEEIAPSERDPLHIIGQVVYQAGPVRS